MFYYHLAIGVDSLRENQRHLIFVFQQALLNAEIYPVFSIIFANVPGIIQKDGFPQFLTNYSAIKFLVSFISKYNTLWGLILPISCL